MPVICLRESCGKRHQLSVKLSWECLHTKKNTKAETMSDCMCECRGRGSIECRNIESVARWLKWKRYLVQLCLLFPQIKIQPHILQSHCLARNIYIYQDLWHTKSFYAEPIYNNNNNKNTFEQVDSPCSSVQPKWKRASIENHENRNNRQ